MEEPCTSDQRSESIRKWCSVLLEEKRPRCNDLINCQNWYFWDHHILLWMCDFLKNFFLISRFQILYGFVRTFKIFKNTELWIMFSTFLYFFIFQEKFLQLRMTDTIISHQFFWFIIFFVVKILSNFFTYYHADLFPNLPNWSDYNKLVGNFEKFESYCFAFFSWDYSWVLSLLKFKARHRPSFDWIMFLSGWKHIKLKVKSRICFI